MKRCIALPVSAAAAAVCLASAPAAGAAPAATVRPSAARSCVRTFHAPTFADYGPFGVTAGPGGTWYSDGPTIDKIESGRTTTYHVPGAAGTPANVGWLARYGSTRLLFADRDNGRIGTINSAGAIHETQIPAGSAGAAVPQALVVRPDAIWFTDQQNNRLGRYTPSTGRFRFFATPSAFPLGLVRAGDGDFYFTERSVDKVARFDPRTRLFTEWTLPHGAFPNRLTVAPDGTVWFTSLMISAVWHIDRTGHLRRRSVAGGPVGITYWRRHLWTAMFISGRVAELNLNGKVVKTWAMPDAANAGPLQIAASHGRLWTTGNVDVYRVNPNC